MPPYLLTPEPAGLEAHYRALARATRLVLILYQRDNAVFSPASLTRVAELPNVIGLKDGLGQMERLLRQRQALGDRHCFMNGMFTAEMSAPAFAGLGIRSYSSSVYNLVPAMASELYRALCAHIAATMTRLIEGFYRPFVERRDKARGYTVSLLKAGLDLVGRPAGPLRPPLVNPPDEHRETLREILVGVGVP